MIGTKILEERESKYNGHLRVVKSLGLGMYIQANGLTQSGGIVETFWRSTLKRIIKLKNKPINTCLILGLGGGTVAMLIRKLWPESKIVGVDVDPAMVELGKKYLDLDKAGATVKIRDAYDFGGKYDLIVIDLYNGDQFPEKFASEQFLQKVKTSLSKGGVAIFNRIYYGDMRPKAVKFGLKLQKVFSRVEYHYPEANLMFLCYNK